MTVGNWHTPEREHAKFTAPKSSFTVAIITQKSGFLFIIFDRLGARPVHLSLVGFGSFEVRERAARTGRNPKTGAELKIAASKTPAFKPGATLKAAVNGAQK